MAVIHNCGCGRGTSLYWEKIDCFSNLWLVPYFIVISTQEIDCSFGIGTVECPGSTTLTIYGLLPMILSLSHSLSSPLSLSVPFIDLLLVVSYSSISTDIYVCSCWSPVPIMGLSDRHGQCFNTSLLRKNVIFKRHVLSQHFHPKSSLCKRTRGIYYTEPSVMVELQGRKKRWNYETFVQTCSSS